MNRNLDKIYFRVMRDGKGVNVCFSDLTPNERADIYEELVLKGDSHIAEYYRRVAYHLADRLKAIGDELDLRGE